MPEPSKNISRTDTLADGLYVALSGEIDLSTSPQVRAALLEHAAQQPRRIVIDMSAVPYMDSSGVATLVEALQHQRRHQGRLVLCGLQPKVKTIFEIARLNTIFTITENAEAAKKA